jgi:aryl-alcohol dehydrogenase-like predicted oxidoreductase
LATIPQVTLAWLLSRKVVTSVIIGAKRLDQLEDNLGSVRLQLSDEEIAQLDAASEPSVEYPGWFLKQFDSL